MKSLFAFAILLLSVSSFDISENISDEDFAEFHNLIVEPVTPHFVQGDWRVIGMPGVIQSLRKSGRYY